jgi:hypothetical protein
VFRIYEIKINAALARAPRAPPWPNLQRGARRGCEIKRGSKLLPTPASALCGLSWRALVINKLFLMCRRQLAESAHAAADLILPDAQM